MLSYEIALSLKESGFPQVGYGGYYKPPVNKEEYIEPKITDLREHVAIMDVYTTPECTRWVYVPTLSELIEACGEEFESLTQWGDGWHVDSKGILRHDMVDEECPEPIRCESGCCGTHTQGSSPEEAVASLWLALNKK